MLGKVKGHHYTVFLSLIVLNRVRNTLNSNKNCVFFFTILPPPALVHLTCEKRKGKEMRREGEGE